MQIVSASFLGKRIVMVSGVVSVNNYNIYIINTKLQIFLLKPIKFDVNWASEAIPTLGCSIDISRDM